MTKPVETMERPLRIGAVEYLNTVPLVRGLAELVAPGAELVFDLPSRLADRLAARELDVALAPSIEAARHPEWTILSNACIGCQGPVLSVMLLFRKPPGECETLALDEGSRTSAVLAQILLEDRYGIRPKLVPLPIGANPQLVEADAVLVIGDRAIRWRPIEFYSSWDLGQEWRRMTGLPFVFAMWVARPGVDAWEIEPALEASRDQGRREVEQIADEQSAKMGLPRDMVLRYLRDHLNFFLGARERHGFELYCARAAELGLIPRTSQIVFDDCTAER